MQQQDVIVIGAGAAGLFCAAQAARRGRSVTVIEHAKKIGRKILMSGGGRCNFTNMYTSHENFISDNPHYCKSALSRYTQWDFIDLVSQYDIAYHEKTLGQLFCDHSAKAIVELLLRECQNHGVVIATQTHINAVESIAAGYAVNTSKGTFKSESLVVATGGLSMPKLGATPLGYQIAEQFGHEIVPTRAGLVPLTLQQADKSLLAGISGVSVAAVLTNERNSFNESLLFTHRGISGPAVLQLSSYWQPGEAISINLDPAGKMERLLLKQEQEHAASKGQLSTLLAQHLPKRVVQVLLSHQQLPNKPLYQYHPKQLQQIAATLANWQLQPNGTEGYRTAEVTLGGVSTEQLSSKTMASKLAEGLYFIGEVVDVTGWLGGYNFQWAWSSAWVAGQEA